MPEARVHEFLATRSHGTQNGSHSLKSKATLHPLERERSELSALALRWIRSEICQNDGAGALPSSR